MADSKKDESRFLAAFSYIFFPLAIYLDPKSPLVRLHANQAFNLILLSGLVNFLGPHIWVIGWFLIWPLGNLLCLVFWFSGVIMAFSGSLRPLPLVGRWLLLDKLLKNFPQTQ